MNDKNNIKRLARSEKDKIIAGVAGGLAKYFDIDPVIIRVAFVLITVWGGSGALIYIILWIVMPLESSDAKDSSQSVKENTEELKDKAEEVASEIKEITKRKDSNIFAGLILLIIGTLFLSKNFHFFDFISISRIWPLFLISIGLIILFKKD